MPDLGPQNLSPGRKLNVESGLCVKKKTIPASRGQKLGKLTQEISKNMVCFDLSLISEDCQDSRVGTGTAGPGEAVFAIRFERTP